MTESHSTVEMVACWYCQDCGNAKVNVDRGAYGHHVYQNVSRNSLDRLARVLHNLRATTMLCGMVGWVVAKCWQQEEAQSVQQS